MKEECSAEMDGKQASIVESQRHKCAKILLVLKCWCCFTKDELENCAVLFSSFFFFSALPHKVTLSLQWVCREMMRSSQGCQHLRQEHFYSSFCTALLLATLHWKSKCTAKIPRAEVANSAEFQLSLGKTPRRLQMNFFEVFIYEWSVKLPTSRRRSRFFGLELSRSSLSCSSGGRTAKQRESERVRRPWRGWG